MDERDTLRERLRYLLGRPPVQSKIDNVAAVRAFKRDHAAACKVVGKATATTQQLLSAAQQISTYVEQGT